MDEAQGDDGAQRAAHGRGTVRHEAAGTLEALVAALPVCVKVLDREGHLLAMNPAGLAMIEADSLDAVLGQCTYPLVCKEHRDAFRSLVERVCDGTPGGVLRFEIVGLRGGRRWLQMRSAPLRDPASGETRCLAVTRDITDELRAARGGRKRGALSRSRARIRRLVLGNRRGAPLRVAVGVGRGRDRNRGSGAARPSPR